MFRVLLLSFFCALVAAAPVDLDQDGLEIQLGAPDALMVEAQSLLETARIKHNVEQLVARKQIHADALPVPAEFPTGSVKLELSDKQLRVTEQLAAKASWSTNVPSAVDGQFVYHMHLAHLVGQKYRDGHCRWGVALAEFNGNTYGTMVNSRETQPGQHRILGILTAWSIKTEEAHILDVEELACTVRR